MEEGFKPLAVVTMIGRIRNASEAFILGMACGIGFDLIETISYMGIGYNGWINVAVDRSTAGLLHGVGAGMMALGWYYITHKDALKRNHIQIGLGCMLYAILQHAIWNGSFILQFLPDPIGPYLENWHNSPFWLSIGCLPDCLHGLFRIDALFPLVCNWKNPAST